MLATRNAGKIAELSRILADVGGGVEIVGLESFPDAPDVPETGITFADNALLKARAIAACTGLPAVSDDSGLAADALPLRRAYAELACHLREAAMGLPPRLPRLWHV